MAWFYDGKQIYGAWTDGYGVDHPADWETAWSDAEKRKVGLIDKGTLNDRFFDEDGEKYSVDYIQAHEEVRMQGLLAMILGQTMSDTISESDGETLVQIPPEIVAKREQAQESCAEAISLIKSTHTFDGLWDLIMNSDVLVYGVHVPKDSGFWGVKGDRTNEAKGIGYTGYTARRTRVKDFM